MARATAEVGIGTLGTVALAMTATALLAWGWRGAQVAPRRATRSPIATRARTEEVEIPRPPPPSLTAGKQVMVAAARRVNRAAGMLALSVLLDSAVEHYRGSFQNKAMYTPLVVSLLTLAASAHGATDGRPGSHRARNTGYALAAATGLVGTGFHIYNIAKRPRGFSWLNLFYAAPLGAPVALSLAGILGAAAERVRGNEPREQPMIFGLPAGRALAGLAGIGIAGTVGEVGLLHFRGAYHNPFMFLPVTVPPVAAALLINAALGPARRHRRFTRWWLRFTAALGVGGVGFHAFGIARNMGGWSNWSQNLLNGPPLPAPPSFTALSLVGLAALGLLEDYPDV